MNQKNQMVVNQGSVITSVRGAIGDRVMSNRANRRWVVAFVLSLGLIAAASSASRAATIAQWKFDSNAGFFTDNSGNGHTLTVAPETINGTGGASGTNFDGAATF